jgi:hypothetical protein
MFILKVYSYGNRLDIWRYLRRQYVFAAKNYFIQVNKRLLK